MNWWVAISVVCWGAWCLTQKMATRYGSPIEVEFYSLVFASLAAAVVWGVFRPAVNLMSPAIAWSLAGVCLSTVAAIAFMFALQRGDVYRTTALASTYPIVTMALSAVVLRERLTLGGVVGLFITSSGIAMLQWSAS